MSSEHFHHDFSCFCISQLEIWALDFSGNLQKIIQSIDDALSNGAGYRFGPELEISGYSCEDHFFEEDTVIHSYEVLEELLKLSSTNKYSKLIIDVGLPIFHHQLLYNVRAIFSNGKLIFIRAKSNLASGLSHYHENRYFTAWDKNRKIEQWTVPSILVQATGGQTTVPIGGCSVVLDFDDLCLGFESCEEMWVPLSPSIEQSLAGAHVVVNSSASHYQYNKNHVRHNLMKSSSLKSHCHYLYCNAYGMDGRMFFDGGSAVAFNGEIVKQLPYLSLAPPVQNLIYIFQPHDNRRNKAFSWQQQSINILKQIERVEISHKLCFSYLPNIDVLQFNMIDTTIIEEEVNHVEEILCIPCIWLWCNLCRTNSKGFILSIDESIGCMAMLIIIYHLCFLLFDKISKNDSDYCNFLMEITGRNIREFKKPRDICEYLLTCISDRSNQYYKTIIDEIGCIHKVVDLSKITSINLDIMNELFDSGITKSSNNVNNNFYNIKESSLIDFLIGSTKKDRLLLGKFDSDEILIGNKCKSSLSVTDLNPIGSISKDNLVKLIKYGCELHNFQSVQTPYGNLSDLSLENIIQEISIDELKTLAELRKSHTCGPFSFFVILCKVWPHMSSEQISKKVKSFFTTYGESRRKSSSTSTLHFSLTNNDDSRFDMRPIIYNLSWKWQFLAIDTLISHKTPR